MTSPHLSPAGGPHSDDAHLRLVWPQWQGAGTSSVQAFASEFPLEVAHRGYAVGTTVLDAILPPHEGPTATVPPERFALAGLHSWTDDDVGNVAAWDVTSFSPDELRASTQPLLDWIAATGCSRVAVHFDVDTVDSNEVTLGLGAVPGGLSSTEVRRIVADINDSADVVGLTIAEFLPRQVMHLQQVLDGFPLLP